MLNPKKTKHEHVTKVLLQNKYYLKIKQKNNVKAIKENEHKMNLVNVESLSVDTVCQLNFITSTIYHHFVVKFLFFSFNPHGHANIKET